jgi:membrane fusion protein (multidrug efflux system)
MVDVPPKPKKRALRAYLLLVGLALAAVAVYLVHSYLTRNEVATDDAQVDADIVPLSARVGGVIKKMYVEDNQPVKAGDVIAEIDPADLTAKVAAAKAELEAANAQADSADAQIDVVKSTSAGGLSSARAALQGNSASVRSAAAQVQMAQAQVARAQAESSKAQADYDRAKKLHDAGAVSGQALEAATVARDSAKASVDAANANLAAARDSESQAEAHVAEARGHVEQSTSVDRQVASANAAAHLAHARAAAAQAALDLAQLQLGYTKITAPVAGYASKLAVHEGQLIQPGALLMMIVPARSYVIANFKETQIERIRAGDEVDITVDALGGKTYTGKVASLAPGTGARFSMIPPDNATGNFVKVVQRVPVKIVFAEKEDTSQLHAGLSVEVKVHLQP